LTCLLAAVVAGHLLFLATAVAQSNADHSAISRAPALWLILFWVPCLCIGYFARRFPVLQSVAIAFIAMSVIDKFDYVPFFRRAWTWIPPNVSKAYIAALAAWLGLAALLGFLGALLRKYITKKRLRARPE
jgi:hypothetical protein